MSQPIIDQQTGNSEMKDFKNFLTYERFLSNITVQKYVSDISRFGEFLQNDLFFNKLLSNATKEDIGKFLIYIKAKYSNNNTITNYIVALRTFYTWAAYKQKKENLLDINFFLKNIIKTKKENSIPFVPHPEEISKLRITLKTYKELQSHDRTSYAYKKTLLAYTIFELMINTGIRSHELRSLCFKDIDLQNKTIAVRYGKGGQQRVSLFGKSALEILQEYFSMNNFSSEDKIFPIRQGNVLHYMVKRWAKKANINPKLHIHSFRHYFITESQRQGVPMEIVAEQVGHRNLNSTRHYSHFNIEFIKEKFKEINV
jgi:site-specific recombinase XerD